MTKLNSTEISQRYRLALIAEAEAETHLRQVSTAAVLADVQNSPDEAEARKALADAHTAARRLAEALELVQQTEAATQARLACDRLDAEDAACLQAMQSLAAAAEKAQKSIENYTRSYENLVQAGAAAEAWISRVRARGGVRADLIIPPCAQRFTEQLARVGQAPGHSVNARTLGHVTGMDRSLTDEVWSVTSAAIADLQAAKARRDRSAPEPVDWSVVRLSEPAT